MAKTKTRTAPPVEEIEDLEDAFEELDDEEAAPAPAPKKKAASAKAGDTTVSEKSEFDTNWLATQVAETTGTPCDGRTVRITLRKMAAAGELAREVGTDRARYTFPKGLNDPTVKAVLKLAKAGGLVATRKAATDDAPKPKKKAAAPVVEESDLPEELEAPVTKKKKAPAADAAPAKAQPSTKRARVRA